MVVDARAPEYRRVPVRNRRTGLLEEVELTEAPPVDPGNAGRMYTFRRDEEVAADHEAVLANPSAFDPVED